MITTYRHEEHKFKTAEAARAFCRIHPEFFIGTGGSYVQPTYSALRGLGLTANQYDISCTTGSISGSSNQDSVSVQLEQKINECQLSYKNMITAGLLGSLTGTKYKMGNESISHPVIFTYAIGLAAPELTLWFLIVVLAGILFGSIPWISTTMWCCVCIMVEVIIPWINSYNNDPIEEPWMIPNHLRENGCWN